MKKVNIDFLCIGAQKTGTSWLWNNLRQNKEIWLTPRKELHYFDRSLRYPSPSFLATNFFLKRLLSHQEQDKHFRLKAKTELKQAFKSKNKENILWHLKYFLGTYDDDWYRSLFEKGKDKVSGEMTPAYSILEVKDIKKIKSLFPNLKIILILRDPIERAWSQIRFYMTRNEFDEKSDLEQIKEYIDSPMQSLRSDYVNMIHNWNQVFGQEKLHICFYDDIQTKPEVFLKNIAQFLKVSNNFNHNFITKKVNVSIKKDIPKSIEYYLANKYLEELNELSKIVPIYPQKWLNRCKKVLDDN